MIYHFSVSFVCSQEYLGVSQIPAFPKAAVFVHHPFLNPKESIVIRSPMPQRPPAFREDATGAPAALRECHGASPLNRMDIG